MNLKSILPFPMPWMKEDPYKKYEVNVVIDNSETKGAPVIVETNPTYHNLLGRTEKEAQFGALTTDFTHDSSRCHTQSQRRIPNYSS